MNLLAFDASTDHLSITLEVKGTLTHFHGLTPRQHGERLLPEIDALLSTAHMTPKQLDAIAFGQGPGSFIGLRLAASTAQGLSMPHNTPLYPISSLRCLAQTCAIQKNAECLTSITALLDAKKNDFYVGQYAIVDGIAQTQEPDQLLSHNDSQQLLTPSDNTTHGYCGYGCTTLTVPFTYAGAPHAQALLALLKHDMQTQPAVKPAKALPAYLRNNVAWN